jgi:hypothetical protein
VIGYIGLKNNAAHIPLTEQQQQAIDAVTPPPRLIDPRNSSAYVLVPEDEYEAVREALKHDRRQRAIRRVALRNAAGRLTEAP